MEAILEFHNYMKLYNIDQQFVQKWKKKQYDFVKMCGACP